MFINNNPQNLISVIPEGKNSSQLKEFRQNLTLGQILKGKIFDVLSGGKVLADFKGQRFTLQTAGGLTKGQEISVRVDQLNPSINLKIISIKKEENTPSLQLTSNTKTQLSQTKMEVLQKLNINLLRSTLKPGQALEGKVLKVLDSKTLQVEFQGKQFPVKITGDDTFFPPRQSITAKVQKDSGGLSLIAQKQNASSLPVDVARLKPYLVAKQELGLMAATLENTILKNPLLKELKVDPRLLERLLDTIRVLYPKDGKLPNNSGLKEQINLSGINYEAKVKKSLSEKIITTEGKAILARDLKGQLLELQGNLEKQASLETNQLSSNIGKGKGFQELVNQIKLASDSVEFQQLSNQFAKQDNNPILIQIPDPFSLETKTAKLYIRNEGEGDGRIEGEKTAYNLVFLLNLTALGNLRVDAKTNQNKLVASINVEEKSIADFINTQTQKLESRLGEIGFNAEVTTTVQKKINMEIDKSLNQLLIDEPTRLVDIKT